MHVFVLLMDNSIDNNDDDVDKSQEPIMYINEILIDYLILTNLLSIHYT